jgi:hypothetical protein
MPQLTLREPCRIVLVVGACLPLAALGTSQTSGTAQGVLASRINPEPGPAFSTNPRSIDP